MLIIPAIDLQGGCVVRFVQGKLDKKIYSRDPLRTARHWVRQGARLIHIVDLDGAASGTPKNLAIVKKIVKSIDTPVEFGGGVRNIKTIKELLDLGVSRVVLGTRAAQDNNFLKKAFRQFKDRIIVSIDAEGSRLFIKGWDVSLKGMDTARFGRLLKEIGFKQVIYTDIAKDGTLKGPNIKATKSLLKETGLKVIASGGISSLDDIARLKLLEKKD
ncbi:MAG: 1-(5-phosphoribosyl)-5-[(5-phosphoribosylamino)methylideneamino]imidazole-4-carboxamide isomerase [Candidatus Omnitrophota bacterium]|jgi:phosphoribosylformimino-5-aminoimidazole carboxamide ribotide isomerase